jgi:enolase
MKINRISAREIYDSQGWPTVLCEIFLDNGQSVEASVPSGKSKGPYEAVELRDGGPRLAGKGVRCAVETIEQVIAPLFIGREPQALEMDISMIELDGTEDKSKLGANSMLAVSMALYRAEALSEHMELYELFASLYDTETVSMPFPMLNVINGGVHADSNVRIQEFMIVPVMAQTFRSAFEVSVLAFHELGNLLTKMGKKPAFGREGGYVCHFESDFEALDILATVIKVVNDTQPINCVIALDVAASEFYNVQNSTYDWFSKQLSLRDMIEVYQEIASRYPLYSLEDPLTYDDWFGWIELTQVFDQKLQIVGDDLFATHASRIQFGALEKAATAAIIKPNQCGTIAETLQAIATCKASNLNTIVSHRSSETEDSFIADLAVGTSAGQIKSGSCCRSERLAKYNRLLAIEDTLTFAQFDE